MPCRCDNDEIDRARRELTTERARVEHLNQMLYSAQGIIHSLLKIIDGERLTGTSLATMQEIRPRADDHVSALFKRVAALTREAEALERKAGEKRKDASKYITIIPTISDEDIIG